MSADKSPAWSQIFSDLLTIDVEAWECRPRLHFVNELLPEERPLIEKAVDKRRAEFAAARVMARRAMVRLGVTPEPVLRADDRSPRWPEGIVGTITHTDGYCAVALASSSRVRSLGIDAEVDGPLKPEIIERVCTESERLWLASHAPEERGHLAKLIFSAKESFYKCQHPLTKTFLGFQDVSLEIDIGNTEFRVTFLDKLTGVDVRVREAEGHYRIANGLILTAMTLPNEP